MAPIDGDVEANRFAALTRNEDKVSIVKEMARAKPDPKTTIEPVFAVNINGLAHPVSPNEEQMVQLFTQAPLSSAYNVFTSMQVQYPVDVAIVLQALNILIKRHDILRSTWHMGDSAVPVRRIHSKSSGDVSVIYVDTTESIGRIFAAEQCRPHQIGVSAARFLIVGVHNDRQKCPGELGPHLGINFHHAVGDADALHVAIGEIDLIISYLFRGFSEQAVMEKLPPLTVQFSDYSYWQRSLMARGLLKQDLAVWYSSITSSCPPMVLDVPMDAPRPRIFSAVGGSVKIRIDQELLEPILQKGAVTPYVVVFTTYTIAMCRLCGQPRVNVAIPYGTRASPSLYPLIGDFLNMLPATFDYLPSDSYGTVLDRCATIQLNARKFALAPFLTIVNMLRRHNNPQMDPSRNPVYQSMLDLIPSASEEGTPTMGGVMDIFAFACTHNGMMRIMEVGYNSQMFTRSTAHRLLMQMKAIQIIVGHQANQGGQRLYSLPLPTFLPSWEEAYVSSTESSVGSFSLKIYGNSEDAKDEECHVSLVRGFGVKGTPDEYDFFRRSLRFARHSGVMPTTDIGHPRFGAQYQIPPRPPKRKGETQVDIALPTVSVDDSYAKPSIEPQLEWRPSDAQPLVNEHARMLEGAVESYDAANGFGFITCSSVNDPIPFFSLPPNMRPRKKEHIDLKGLNVAFSYFKCSSYCYATGLRILDD